MVLAQKDGKEDHDEKFTNTFNAKENNWGYAHFVSFDVS
jgi:hypothetical protein